MQISLALTHYNRFPLLQQSIAPLQADPRIAEIVISDDCSTDGSWERIGEEFGGHPKVRAYRNEKNLDCYRNKRESIARSTYPWVFLLDSDNVAQPAYLDRLFTQELQDNTFYCPDFAEPEFDYTWLAGRTVTKRNVASLVRDGNLLCALNTANYVVPREGYLRVWGCSEDPMTSDSLWQAYCWLAQGGQITFVPRMRYYHRVHAGSHYKLNHHKTGAFADKVKRLILDLK